MGLTTVATTAPVSTMMMTPEGLNATVMLDIQLTKGSLVGFYSLRCSNAQCAVCTERWPSGILDVAKKNFLMGKQYF